MPADAGLARRIFVVGAPRSGTTLVQSLLAAHSATTSFTESHLFDRHFTLLPGMSRPLLTRNPAPRLHAFLAENGETSPDALAWFETRDRWLRVRWLLPFMTRPVARQLLLLLDQLALRRGFVSWVEKTPMHLRYTPFLARVSGPEARTRCVHVIREGLEVVSSLYAASESWERPYDLDECVRRWNADVRFSLGRLTAPGNLVVFYEELTSQPEAALRRLVAGLGLGWEPEMLERYASTAGQLITSEETWKADVGRSIARSRTSENTLTAAQRARVTQSLHSDLYALLLDRTGGAHTRRLHD